MYSKSFMQTIAIFYFIDYNHRYPHFKMAPWMNTTGSYENYEFTEGNLLIKKTGLYILYANVSNYNMIFYILYYI